LKRVHSPEEGHLLEYGLRSIIECNDHCSEIGKIVAADTEQRQASRKRENPKARTNSENKRNKLFLHK
jgi:hypothetical protein